MNKSSISIIIPVYNVEEYLPKCLNSILAQTHSNWEAVLINDGSTDNSGIICNEYAQKDNRIKVIHQTNGGVSEARQAGLDNATGDYVIHCDPDDWIEPTMLEELYRKAVEENADMVICDIITHHNNKTEHNRQKIEEGITAKELQTRIIDLKIHGSCCNKLVKRKYCKNIRFSPTSITYCEDELFNIKILCVDIKIIYLNKGLYHYVQHKNSNSSPSKKRIQSRIEMLEELYKITSSPNDFFSIKKEILIAAFLSKDFITLKNYYPEIHKELISSGYKYNVFMPLKSNLSIALRGHPLLAYNMYVLNMFIIKAFNKFKCFILKRDI